MPILKSNESHSSDTQLLSKTTFDYANDSANLGRLTGLARTHYPNDDSGKSYVTTQTFTCETDPVLTGALRYTNAISTYDGLKVNTDRSGSAFTGRLWRSTNARGVSSSNTYDGLGRLTARTLAVGTDYENTVTFGHIITGGTDEAFQSVTTDCQANKTCRGLDGMGRQVYTAINAVDYSVADTQYKTTVRKYDELGRLATSTWTDYLPEPSETYSLTGTRRYDDWGQLCRVDYDNGSWHSKILDPIARTATMLAGGTNKQDNVTTGQTVVTHSASGRPVKMARYAANVEVTTGTPYSVHTMAYDGLGRLRSETDTLGCTTTYNYDDWGRAIQTTLPDGTVVKRRYRADSPVHDVVEITLTNTAQQVAETSMGTRDFDGLSRIVSATVGGRSWQYQYDAPSANSQLMNLRPTQVTAPDNTVRQYAYIPELGNKLGTVKAYKSAGDSQPAIIQIFKYHKTTGAMTSASQTAAQIEGTSAIQYTPHPSGRLKSEALVLDTTRTMMHDLYTVGGKPHQYTHTDGAVRITKRDTYGRISEVSDDKMKATLTYDPAGRLTAWQACDLTSDHTLRTALTLDDYGRETGRATWENNAPPNNPTWEITQCWNEANLLTTRTTARAGSPYRTETYGYDKRNRLTNWASSGVSPTDRYGNTLLTQTFTLDPFSNITQVVSTFPNNESNTASFWYDTTNPCMLASFSNTHPSYPAHGDTRATVSYDGANRTIGDGMGNTFDGYDELGRLKQVTNAAGESAYYGYDAHNRRYSQVMDSTKTYFYYKAGALVNLVQGDNTTRMLRSPAGCTSNYIDQGGSSNVWLSASDSQGAVLAASDGANHEEYAYSAYGEDQPKNRATALGYTGQYRDPVLPGYMLGNGYRAYLPGLMRFAQPDSPTYSPFGKGGINPYIYCAGDPINRSDPSGHFFLTHWFHDLGNSISHHFPGFSHFFHKAGDRLLNVAQLRFLPNKGNPWVWMQRAAHSKYLRGWSPFYWTVKESGAGMKKAAGVIHSTTGLSNSWSMLSAQAAIASIPGMEEGGDLLDGLADVDTGVESMEFARQTPTAPPEFVEPSAPPEFVEPSAPPEFVEASAPVEADTESLQLLAQDAGGADAYSLRELREQVTEHLRNNLVGHVNPGDEGRAFLQQRNWLQNEERRWWNSTMGIRPEPGRPFPNPLDPP